MLFVRKINIVVLVSLLGCSHQFGMNLSVELIRVRNCLILKFQITLFKVFDQLVKIVVPEWVNVMLSIVVPKYSVVAERRHALVQTKFLLLLTG